MRASLSRQEDAANKGVSEESVRFVDYLFNPQGPKFLFDDIYHFSMRHYRRHANNRNMLPVVKLMTATVLERMASLPAPVLFVPEAITNGIPYLELAESHAQRIKSVRGGDLTTYRMGEILNKDELDALTEKNKNRAMTRLEGFRRLYPHYSVMSPTGMEALLKTLVKEAGFTNYQMLRDEDFEAFWIAVCLNSLRGGFADDVAYSRNGNFETFALFQVQYGIVPFRPRGDINVVMPNKKIATPYDYTEMLFAHLLDVVPRGFTSDLSVKMAMRMLMLEDMRTKGLAHPEWGALLPEKMNPELRGLSASHEKAFAKLRRDLLGFMKYHKLEKNLGDMYGLDGYDRLKEYYREQDTGVMPAAEPRGGGGGSGGGGAYVQESRAKLDMDAKLKKKALFNILSFSIPYQLDGDFFSPLSRLLPDHDFSSLGQAEQIALKAFMGLSETVKPSQKLTQSGFIMIDRRGGETARSYAEDYGLVVPGEARGLKTSFQAQHFDDVVKKGNIEKARLIKDQLLRAHIDMNVSSFEQIEHDAEVFRSQRSAIAAPGPDRLSASAKIIYATEILRRSSDLAVFDRGWETSSLLVALRTYARKIQLGLVERPVNRPLYHLNVADIALINAGHTLPYTVCSLSDDLAALTGYVKHLSDSGVEEYPRQPVRGLLETIVMIDLYYNKNLNLAAAGGSGKPLIDWQAVPLSLKDGLENRKEDVLALRQEAKTMLTGKALLALAPEELTGQLEMIDPDYISAWRELQASQDRAKSRQVQRSSQRRVKGFDAT